MVFIKAFYTFAYQTERMKIPIKTRLNTVFTDKEVLTRAELLVGLSRLYPRASQETLIWHVHSLKTQGLINSPGRGLYRLGTQPYFQPVLDSLSLQIADVLARELPLVKNCIWETRWISNWMELQPAYNWIIIEVEKEVLASVFSRLRQMVPHVFLDPGPEVIDMYIASQNDALIVKPLLSGSPVIISEKHTLAAPEKILVDILAEPILFRAQQNEADRIYAHAFRELNINQSKMLRYARRRNRGHSVLGFIPEAFHLPAINYQS